MPPMAADALRTDGHGHLGGASISRAHPLALARCQVVMTTPSLSSFLIPQVISFFPPSTHHQEREGGGNGTEKVKGRKEYFGFPIPLPSLLSFTCLLPYFRPSPSPLRDQAIDPNITYAFSTGSSKR
ncbi:hypothetical protein TNIN_410231 [Trichonephila inaurata madagascariensis]|uniref:Uncharacterized protein n=1 Tax=Trichonephila inaurata madagascariensis TaxID=2747483 RepID=A0A8X6IP98_9ARAC|nr:hypothetical protein TNIN_410231 [Trichonephila inaurata madagascariensis]